MLDKKKKRICYLTELDDNKYHVKMKPQLSSFPIPALSVRSCAQYMGRGYSPGGAVDPEAPHRDLRVLQVDAVGEQRLDVLIILRL